jgi:hypothetical protein
VLSFRAEVLAGAAVSPASWSWAAILWPQTPGLAAASKNVPTFPCNGGVDHQRPESRTIKSQTDRPEVRGRRATTLIT